MDTLRLDCTACGRVTELSAEEQVAILLELTRPAHSKIIECSCTHSQVILAARRVEPKKAA